MSQAEFDRFATTYERDLAASLAATGEDRSFYAQGRIVWTGECAARLGVSVDRILDFGCGDGKNAPLLAGQFQSHLVLGVDISGKSIAEARRLNSGSGVSFLTTQEWTPDGKMDLAFVNGVFHHIQPSERLHSLQDIRRSLRPGALLAFWENNPWNPGTRYVMRKCAFDRNAITISPTQARALLTAAGFRILRLDSMFYFPHALRMLRPAERWLRRLPLGGQYLALCRA